MVRALNGYFIYRKQFPTPLRKYKEGAPGNRGTQYYRSEVAFQRQNARQKDDCVLNLIKTNHGDYTDPDENLITRIE